MKILILCTGNSCRSQMAEGFLKSFDSRLNVVSAGTEPSGEVHPKAIIVMNETGIDISQNKPKSVDQFINQSFDYVITVCGGANDNCPTFIGDVKNRIHIGFDDPAEVHGEEGYVLDEFRRIRDEIKSGFGEYFVNEIKPKL